MSIERIKGNLLDFSNWNVIAHCCNMQGVMGSGIALQIKEEFPAAFEAYRKDFEAGECKLGQFSVAEVAGGKRIVNLYGQEQYGTDRRHLDYEAIYVALSRLKDLLEGAAKEGRIYTLGIPYKMGCDRAGGSWKIMTAMLEDLFGKSPIKLMIVELVKKA